MSASVVAITKKATFNVCDAYREAGKLELATRVYRNFAQLARKHPGEGELLHQQAKAATNLCTRYAVQEPDVADEIYRELDALARMYLEDRVISSYRNNCVLNLVQIYLFSDDVDRARALASSTADILQAPDFRAAIAAGRGSERAEQFFTLI